MAETKGKLVINNLHNITLKVEVSKSLTLRLQIFQWLMRLACWVGSVGVEFVEFEPPNKACSGRLESVRTYSEDEVEEVAVGEYRLKNRRR